MGKPLKCKRCHRWKKDCNCGRPLEFTPEVVKKLEEAFSIDASISEACFYANISRQSYYNNVKEGMELFDRFEALRQKPILKARQTIVKSLDDPYHAQWYAERKRKSEFATRQEIDQRSVVLIGEVLKKVETENELRAKDTQQKLSTSNILLDSGQTGQESSIPAKQSTKRFRAKKA